MNKKEIKIKPKIVYKYLNLEKMDQNLDDLSKKEFYNKTLTFLKT